MLKQHTNFWNRLIPYCWEETLSGQQFIIGQRWWREVRRQTLLHDIGHKIHSPIFVTFDEAERFFSKTPPLWKVVGNPGYGKTYQPAQ